MDKSCATVAHTFADKYRERGRTNERRIEGGSMFGVHCRQ
jgi:hypothetical protein